MENKKGSSYLSKLKFDPSLLRSFKAKYLTNIRVVILLVLIIIAVGTTSFFLLPRRLNPEIKIPIVGVSTVLPGASPKDVESLITIPLEDSIKSIKGITDIDSVSNESFSSITIQFSSRIDADKARDDVQAAVTKVNTLPSDAQTPNVRKFDFEDQPIWVFAVRGRDPASLGRFTKALKKKLENTANIDRVTITGLEEQEFAILADPEKISTNNINPLLLSQAVRNSLNSFPAGNLDTKNSSISIGIDAPITSINDIRNTVLNLNGQQVAISDIASVMERSKPNQTSSYLASDRQKPTPVITLYVFKTTAATIDAGNKAAKDTVEGMVKEYNNQFSIHSISDVTDDIGKEFGHLTDSFRDTLILVFITFLIFLGVRQALIAILTIPLTFLVSFTVANAAGLSLNFLTLFSLLLSLGLLVDDTIVIVTGMTSYYRTGKFTTTQAGLLVWRDFIVPIWSTTITTVWAFVPLLLATGIIGEFLKTLPIVVSTTLYASTAIAVFVTLPLMMIILKPEIPKRVKIFLKIIGVLLGLFVFYSLVKGNPFALLILLLFVFLVFITYRVRYAFSAFLQEKTGRNLFKDARKFLARFNERLIDIEHFAVRYKTVIRRIILSKTGRRNVLITVALFTVFAYFLLPLGFVVNEFFPKIDQDFIYVALEMPSGSNLKATTQETVRILEDLRKTTGIASVTGEVGRGIDTSSGNLTSTDTQSLFTLNLPVKEKRSKNSLEIADSLRKEFKTYKSKGTLSVVEQSGGPPAGADVQVLLLGDDLNKLDSYADKAVNFLQKQPGIVNAKKSIKPGASRLTFVPDRQTLAKNNLDISSVGLFLRTFATGSTVDKVKFNGDEEEDITFRVSSDISTPNDLGRIMIPTQSGQQIPLLSLGTLKLENNPTTITRHNSKRSISISAGVAKGYSVSTLNQKFLNYVKNDLSLENGYSYQTGGVNEENQKSVTSILQAMLLTFVLILATMVIQFRSYRQSLIVMLVIPIAISGVFVVFALTGTPLSLPALIGVLSLFGIVVTHAMMLVDKINRNLSSGMTLVEGLSDGAASRLEPVFIGSFTTIIGLIPISLSNPLWRGLGGAIIAGLTFSGIIMLFFIPVMYFIIYQSEYKKLKRLV